MPSLEDDGNKTLATQNQENPGVGGPTFNKLLAARDGEERRDTQQYIGHQSDPLQYNGQVGKILKNCTTPSTQDRIPVALMNGHRLSVKITILEIAPTAQSSSFPKITQQTMDTTETTREEEVESEDTQSEEHDGGHLLDFVYDGVKNGQSPYVLERDGW